MNPFYLYGAIAYNQKKDFGEIVSSAIQALSECNFQTYKFKVGCSKIDIIPCFSKEEPLNGSYSSSFPIEYSRIFV